MPCVCNISNRSAFLSASLLMASKGDAITLLVDAKVSSRKVDQTMQFKYSLS